MTDTKRVYFAVPTHYTIGKEFDTYAEAVDYARSTITPFDGIPGESRAFVDVRVVMSDDLGGVDKSIHRVEVFSEKKESRDFAEMFRDEYPHGPTQPHPDA
jgi:hypothetical protein